MESGGNGGGGSGGPPPENLEFLKCSKKSFSAPVVHCGHFVKWAGV